VFANLSFTCVCVSFAGVFTGYTEKIREIYPSVEKNVTVT